jgi:hypothetical protein
MKNHGYRTAFALLTALTLTGTVVAQDQGREFHWTGKLAADQVVEIKNISGKIAADGVSGNQIEVTAAKIGPKADQIKIEVVPSSEGVTICAMYPNDSFGGSMGPCESGNHWHNNNVHTDNNRVDFTVHLPKNLRFAAISVNGGIEAENMGRVVHAESVNGSVQVSTDAWADANSVNGSVHIRMGNAGWTGKLKVSTVNGAVELEMPDDLSANVKFSSVNGRIESAFPVTITGGFVGHNAKGTIGSGGRELEVNTVNGSITLTKGGSI